MTLIHRGARLLDGFDAEISGFVAAELLKKGIRLKLETGVQRL